MYSTKDTVDLVSLCGPESIWISDANVIDVIRSRNAFGIPAVTLTIVADVLKVPPVDPNSGKLKHPTLGEGWIREGEEVTFKIQMMDPNSNPFLRDYKVPELGFKASVMGFTSPNRMGISNYCGLDPAAVVPEQPSKKLSIPSQQATKEKASQNEVISKQTAKQVPEKNDSKAFKEKNTTADRASDDKRQDLSSKAQKTPMSREQLKEKLRAAIEKKYPHKGLTNHQTGIITEPDPSKGLQNLDKRSEENLRMDELNGEIKGNIPKPGQEISIEEDFEETIEEEDQGPENQPREMIEDEFNTNVNEFDQH